MKKLFKKLWFQIVFFGVLVGGLLILADNKFGLIKSLGKKETGTYQGPVSASKDEVYMTKIKFDESEFDFGKVKEGDTVSHIFKITNAGNAPLFVYKIAGSCDCVGTSFGKDMLAAGQADSLAVFFDSKGRKGMQTRTVTITANTEPSETVLTIKANVE